MLFLKKYKLIPLFRYPCQFKHTSIMSSDEYYVKLEFLKNAHLRYPGIKSAKTDGQVRVESQAERNKIAVMGFDDDRK